MHAFLALAAGNLYVWSPTPTLCWQLVSTQHKLELLLVFKQKTHALWLEWFVIVYDAKERLIHFNWDVTDCWTAGWSDCSSEKWSVVDYLKVNHAHPDHSHQLPRLAADKCKLVGVIAGPCKLSYFAGWLLQCEVKFQEEVKQVCAERVPVRREPFATLNRSWTILALS